MQEAEELILFKAPADVQTALIIYQASSTVLSHIGSLEIFSFLIHLPHISESCTDEADSGIYMRLNEEKNLSYQVMTKMDMSQLTKYCTTFQLYEALFPKCYSGSFQVVVSQ